MAGLVFVREALLPIRTIPSFRSDETDFDTDERAEEMGVATLLEALFTLPVDRTLLCFFTELEGEETEETVDVTLGVRFVFFFAVPSDSIEPERRLCEEL